MPSEDDRAPVWPGTGEALVLVDGGRDKAHLGPIRVERFGGTWMAWYVPLNIAEARGIATTPQAALDALHARLCEQHDALAAVTGRGTVAQVVAWLRGFVPHVALYPGELAADIEAGEHIPTHEDP